jgi:hypothetical protein
MPREPDVFSQPTMWSLSTSRQASTSRTLSTHAEDGSRSGAARRVGQVIGAHRVVQIDAAGLTTHSWAASAYDLVALRPTGTGSTVSISQAHSPAPASGRRPGRQCR